jgi:RNA polymerase sigma-70 factor (ECF subfamily)
VEPENFDDRLSRIQTEWTLVRQAHDGPTDAVRAAQEKLLARYGGAVQRYLVSVVRDRDRAEELFQEFAYRLVNGDLHGADPQRGRFRNFVKGVLFHLIADDRRRHQRQPGQLPLDHQGPAVDAESHSSMDASFLSSWREDLLARCWAALEATEKETGKLFYTVLRFRAEHAELSSTEMANQLSTQCGRPLTAENVRQLLHRAREKFAALLLDEVVQSLDDPSAEQLEQELIELGLMEYCRSAFGKRDGQLRSQ